MIPNVSQQLSAIRHTIAKTIVPAIDPGDSFAQEQAGLVLASLDWALDVAGSEYRYELVEHDEYLDVLGQLLALEPPGDIAVRGRAAREQLATAAVDLAALREQNVALKGLVEDAFVARTAERDGSAASDARRIVAALARRQTERELAWGRMTGFPDGADAVSEVLATQSTARGAAIRR